MIKIAPDGQGLVLLFAVLTALALLIKMPRVALCFVLLLLFVGFFFRDPERVIVHDEKRLLSPADGTVLSVNDISFEGLPYTHVVIFLSVFNTHINRIPLSGTVTSVQYFRGAFKAAYQKGIEKINERNEIVFETESGKIKVVQISGWIARRIVCRLVPGEKVRQGDRFGMIKFGSRTDVLFPRSLETLVHPGDKLKAGITCLATR